MTPQKKSLYGGILVLLLGSLTLTALSFTRTPQLEIHWGTTSPSFSSLEALDSALLYPVHWPKWIRGLERAEIIDVRGMPLSQKDQHLMPGSSLRLTFKKTNEEEKAPTSSSMILTYIPRQELAIQVISPIPSRGFRPLGSPNRSVLWRIRLQPQANGATTSIYSEIRTQANTWQAKLWGSWFPYLYLKPSLLPDSEALAEIKDVLTTNPRPAHEL